MIKILFNFIRTHFHTLLKWVKNNKLKVILISIVTSIISSITGLLKIFQAKTINDRALEIHSVAMKKYEKAYNDMQLVLAKLGKSEKSVIDSFAEFADAMEKIQGRPQIKTSGFASVKLPNYEPEEIRHFSVECQVVIEAAGGAGIGALAGFAAFGANAVILSPAMIAPGFVLCLKGNALKKKAIKNEHQAKAMSKDVDKMVDFYSELRVAADSFRESLDVVYSKYMDYLYRFKAMLLTKSTWTEFTEKDKRIVENTVLLARLLYEMTKVKIIEERGTETKLDKINSAELSKMQKKAEKILKNVA